MSEKETSTATGAREMLETALRRKKLFFIPCALVFALSLAAGKFLPRTYEAASLIQTEKRQVADPLARDAAAAPDAREEFDTLAEKVMTWSRLEQLTAQLDLAGKAVTPAEWEDGIRDLRSRIKVRVRNRDLLEIVYQDRDPVRARLVVNTLTRNFVEENSRIKKEEARNAIDFIGEQLKVYRRKLSSTEQNFSTSRLDTDITRATNRKTLLEERLNNLQRILPSQAPAEQNPVVVQLQQRRGHLESELARISLDAKDGNPKVLELKNQIQHLKARIDDEMDKSAVKQNDSTYNPAYLDTEQDLHETEMELDDLLRQKKEIEERKGALKAASAGDLANLARDKEVDEDIYQMLLRQLESAYVTERLQDSEKGDRFTVIEYARLPLKPVKPKMAKVAGMGLMAGLAFGFGCVFLAENLEKSFHTAEQARDALGLAFLGGVSKIVTEEKSGTAPFGGIRNALDRYFRGNPALSKMRFVSPHVAKKITKSGIAPQVVIHHEPKCRVADEYRVIRTNLFHGPGEARPPKTLLVTSTLHGEGKSTTSANLAIAIADTGRRTLLMDCDLRKGTGHDLFGVRQKPGLVEALVHAADIEAVTVKTLVENLSLLPCGERPAKPSELLGSGRMKELMRRVQNEYDVVLLDAPPVLNLPDAGILSGFSDTVLLVVQSGRARCGDVAAAKGALSQVNAAITGFIMTNIEYRMPQYVYDYYYEG